MASANLDLVSSLDAARERGDWRSVEWAHPEIEFVITDGPSPGAWRGVAEMLAQVQTSAAAIFHVRDGKVIKVAVYYDRDRALADLQLRASAARSGA
jgi:hypothetical protein